MHHDSLLMYIKNLVAREWEVKFTHVHQEANRSADWLSNYALQWLMGTHMPNSQPKEMNSVLKHDTIGVAIPHFVVAG